MQFQSAYIYRDAVQFTVSLEPGRIDYVIPFAPVKNSVTISRDGRLLKHNSTLTDNGTVRLSFPPSSSPTLITWFSRGVQWNASYTLLIGKTEASSQLNVRVKNELPFSFSCDKCYLTNTYFGPQQQEYAESRAIPMARQAASDGDDDGDSGSVSELIRTIDLSGEMQTVEMGEKTFYIGDEIRTTTQGMQLFLDISQTGRVSSRLAKNVTATANLPAGPVSVNTQGTNSVVWLGNSRIPDLREGEDYLLMLSTTAISAIINRTVADSEQPNPAIRRVKEKRVVDVSPLIQSTTTFSFLLPFNRSIETESLTPPPLAVTERGYLWRFDVKPGQTLKFTYSFWQGI